VRIDPNPRCECGKVLYLCEERAAFYAVQYAVFYGLPTHPYQCRMHDRFWHLRTVTRKSDIKQWKWMTEGRYAKKRRTSGGSDI
jgi:hypothetical protein